MHVVGDRRSVFSEGHRPRQGKGPFCVPVAKQNMIGPSQALDIKRVSSQYKTNWPIGLPKVHLPHPPSAQ